MTPSFFFFEGEPIDPICLYINTAKQKEKEEEEEKEREKIRLIPVPCLVSLVPNLSLWVMAMLGIT